MVVHCLVAVGKDKFVFMKTKILVISGVSLILAAIAALGSYWMDLAIANQVLVTQKLDTINFVPVTDPNAISDVDLVIAIDNSGSIYYKPGTDKNDLRIRAAELVITSIAADIYPRETSISVFSFGDHNNVLAPLTPLKNDNSRNILIKKAQETGSSNTTNITEVLDDAYYELFESENRTDGNVPALILLTDGEPTSNFNTLPEVQKKVDRLSKSGAHIFIVLLRGAENEKLEEWRQHWYDMSLTHPNLKYYEANAANDLEEIYNDIRNWLDNIGKSSGRVDYDPTRSDEKIVFPPNLQQARLIVRKPETSVNIELMSPDGSSGESLNLQPQQDPSFGDLAGFFKVYVLKQPVAGDWQLHIEPGVAVRYILDFQSIYTVQVLLLKGQDFLNLNDVTTIYADVVDTNLKSAGGEFTLEASLLKDVSPSQNVFGRETIQLGEFTYDPVVSKYVLNVRPEILPGPGEYKIEVKGMRESDGTIANLTRYQITAASMPGDVKLSIPATVECGQPSPEIFNYRFSCSTNIPVKLMIARPEELSKDDLSAKMHLVNNPPVQIPEQQLVAASLFGDFEGTYGELPYPGEYTLTSELNGTSRTGHVIMRRSSSVTKVVLPASIYDLQRRLTMAAILLAIVAFWKPVIVWILSWVLLPFNLVPKGKYNSISTQAMADDFRVPNRSISKTARKYRHLFGVRIGPGESIVVRYPPPVRQAARPRGWMERIQNSGIIKWFFDESEHSYWSVRVIPFVGIVLCEDENETSITDYPPTTINIGDFTVSLLAGENPDLFGWILWFFRR